MTALLLDTCAALWMANGERISGEALQAIDSAAILVNILVSPISSWEVATLVRKGRLTLSMDSQTWFEALLTLPGMRLAPMPPRTLIASAFLPGSPLADPADRIITATARAENFIILTGDRELLRYGDQGHVRVLAC